MNATCLQSNELIIILYRRLSSSKSTMILIFPSVYVSRILFSKNPLVRSVHYASRQPNQFLCFIVIFYCFYYNFFHGKRLPINNVHVDNYDARVNRELSRRRHSADFTPCFTVEKLVNCFLRHEYEKMTKTYHAPSIRFTHI